MVIELPPVRHELLPLGERLRSLREARGLSAGLLAQAMGITRETLLLAERGRMRLGSGSLHRASAALKIPMRLLFDAVDVSQLRPL
jgi:transcriptional regulator with XRE-family HTH domain